MKHAPMALTQARSTGKSHLGAEESHTNRGVVPGLVIFNLVGHGLPVLVLVPSVTHLFLEMRDQAVEEKRGSLKYPVVRITLSQEFPSAREEFPVLQVLRVDSAAGVFFGNIRFPCLWNRLVLGKEDRKALPVGTPNLN